MQSGEFASGGAARPALAVMADFASLAKPKAASLVVVTAAAAMFVAAGDPPPPALAAVALLGGTLVAFGANALNCYLDRRIDALMVRTAARPLPAGRLRPSQALAFGVVTAATGFFLLLVFVNALAAALALGANAFYVLVYTGYLKRRTDQNVVIGGAAGAAAPLIGYAAIAGRLDPAAFALAALVLFWTPPHFWSLALLAEGDYRRAQVPMLPVVRGRVATRRQIVIYAALTALAALLPVGLSPLGWPYAVVALPLSAVLLALALRLGDDTDNYRARAFFRYSVVYLALLCLSMVCDLSLF